MGEVGFGLKPADYGGSVCGILEVRQGLECDPWYSEV